MSVVDLVIVLLILAAVARGLRVGLLQLSMSYVGFILGLVVASQLARLAASHLTSQYSRLAIVLTLEISLALLFWNGGQRLAQRLRPKAAKLHLDQVNDIAGGVLQVLFTLAAVWLLASGLSNLRSYHIGSAVRHSFIISRLNSALPYPPDVIAQLQNVVSPNSFPDVFLGFEPSHTTISPKNKVNNQKILDAEASVVKVQGLGCGRVTYGSGFVADKDLVVTNAHIIAGLKSPQVVDSHKTYSAITVWYDPDLDIAILWVNNLPDRPLALSGQLLPDASAAVTLGFAGGGPLVAQNAVVIDHVNAIGRDIYNQGQVVRQVYELQTNVVDGDSGGPLLSPDGLVGGVTFGKAVSRDNTGYALLIDQVRPLLAQAKHKTAAADTGYCTDD